MNPPPLPPVIKEQAKEKTSAVSAAKFSLWAPVLTVPINLVVSAALSATEAAQTYLGTVVHCGASGLVIVAGFALGWFALWKTRQCGREGIWGRAVAGIVINGVLLVGVAFVAVKIIQRLSH
jgi:protein-S-isoprenylcysteine O-methyltransferase Ste14